MNINGITSHCDGIGEHGIVEQILGCQLVDSVNFPALPNANAGARHFQTAVLKTRNIPAHKRNDLMRLLSAFNLRLCQLKGIHRGLSDNPGHIQDKFSLAVCFKAQHHIPVHVKFSGSLGSLYPGIGPLDARPGNLLQMVEGNGLQHILPVILYEFHNPVPVNSRNLDVHGHRLRQVVRGAAVNAGHARIGGKIRIGAAIQKHLGFDIKEAVLCVQRHFGNPALLHSTPGIYRVIQQLCPCLQSHGFQHKLHALRVKRRDTAGISDKVLHMSGRHPQSLKP